MIGYLDKIYNGIEEHFDTLPKNWKGQSIDTFAFTFIGTLISSKDLKNSLRFGSAFGIEKAVSLIAFMSFKTSKERLVSSFLKGFILRAVIDRDLKKASFGGFIYTASEVAIIGIEKIVSGNIQTICKAFPNKFASKSASNFSTNGAALSAIEALLAKVFSLTIKNFAEKICTCNSFVEGMESALNEGLQSFLAKRNIREALNEGATASVTFIVKKIYFNVKNHFFA